MVTSLYFVSEIGFRQVRFPHLKLCCKHCDRNERKFSHAGIHSQHRSKDFQAEKESGPLWIHWQRLNWLILFLASARRTVSLVLSGLAQFTPRWTWGTDFPKAIVALNFYSFSHQSKKSAATNSFYMFTFPIFLLAAFCLRWQVDYQGCRLPLAGFPSWKTHIPKSFLLRSIQILFRLWCIPFSDT